jgi:hypothetical protein
MDIISTAYTIDMINRVLVLVDISIGKGVAREHRDLIISSCLLSNYDLSCLTFITYYLVGNIIIYLVKHIRER